MLSLVTREASPLPVSPLPWHLSFHLIDPLPIKSEPSGRLGMYNDKFLTACSDGVSFSYSSYKWPVRSVEKLPPYKATKLKNPVLVIGNMVRVSCFWINLSHDLILTIPG